MKYNIDIHEFSFNKIKNGSRKITVHLFDDRAQKINLHDIINMRNITTGETLECVIKGIALFDNFSDLIDALGAEPLGYDNKKEIMIRLNRMYPQKLQKNYSAVAFFIEVISEKIKAVSRDEDEIEL